MNKNSITILELENSIVAILEHRGHDFAIRFSKDSNVNEKDIRKQWKDCRRLFAPYDRGTDTFLK